MAKLCLRPAKRNASIAIVKGPSVKKQRKDRNFQNRSLSVYLLRNALSFLNRSQLLLLSTISQHLKYVLKKDFAHAPYFVLDNLVVGRYWKVNCIPLVSSFQAFLKQLPLCKFIRFNHTVLSNELASIKDIEHVFAGRELHINTCDIPNPTYDLIKSISNSQDLVLDGNNVSRWLPQILASCTLNSLSIRDAACVQNSIPHIPVDDILAFLFKPASNRMPNKLEIRNEIEHNDSEALVSAVIKKFMDIRSPVEFCLTWFDENSIPSLTTYRNSKIKEELCFRVENFKYSLLTNFY
ncbi:hypothetical protein Ddc_21640 [Ditylenchus destructor]|nr:hypothetical protein Ddc_21640 [Ditylenchus destructor]